MYAHNVVKSWDKAVVEIGLPDGREVTHAHAENISEEVSPMRLRFSDYAGEHTFNLNHVAYWRIK